MRLKRDQKGFTLVELAIVMVIIGLMIGAVLKGQAMIDDAKQKRFLNDLKGISAAYFTYFDRYNAYPGDDPNGASRGWTGVAAGDADARIEGNYTTPAGESQEAWQALRYTGLLSGDPTATGVASLPSHPYGDQFGLTNYNFGTGVGIRNCVFADNIPGNVAEITDIKFDDGIYNTGTVRGSAAYTSATVDLRYAL